MIQHISVIDKDQHVSDKLSNQDAGTGTKRAAWTIKPLNVVLREHPARKRIKVVVVGTCSRHGRKMNGMSANSTLRIQDSTAAVASYR